MDVVDVAVALADEAADVVGASEAALVVTVVDYNKRNRKCLLSMSVYMYNTSI